MDYFVTGVTGQADTVYNNKRNHRALVFHPTSYTTGPWKTVTS